MLPPFLRADVVSGSDNAPGAPSSTQSWSRTTRTQQNWKSATLSDSVLTHDMKDLTKAPGASHSATSRRSSTTLSDPEKNPLEGFSVAPVLTKDEAARLPRDGLSLAQLIAFRERHHAQLVWKTTRQAVDEVVRPATRESRCSYADLLRANESVVSVRSVPTAFGATAAAAAPPVVGPATVVVSHAWDSSFENLVFALEARYRADASRCFVWLDALCVTQHSSECAASGCTCGADWEPPGRASDVRAVIADAGRLAVVLEPCDKPALLQRTWCLWVRSSIFTFSCQLTHGQPLHLPHC